MKPGQTLILLSGSVPNPALVRRVAALCAGVIVCDGAAASAARLGLRPRFIVGDMDSLPRPLPRRFLPGLVFWCDFDEERSDFAKALELAKRLRSREIYIAGALGGRLDHALVNLALAEQEGRRRLVVVLDKGAAHLLGPGTHRFKLARGEIFSLLSAGPSARVSLSGAKYPLRRATLDSPSQGLSNRALGEVRLSIHRGRAWFCHSGKVV